MAFVDRLAWANLSTQVGESWGLPVAGLEVFVTAFYIGYVGANVLGGLGTDKLGPSRMLTYAMLPLGICTFLFSFAHSLTTGLVLQFAMGAAAGADYSARVKLTATWFEFRMSCRAMGLLITVSSLAIFLTNATVPSLAAMIGWVGVYKVLGAVTCAVGLLCWIFLRDAPSASDSVWPSPKSLRCSATDT